MRLRNRKVESLDAFSSLEISSDDSISTQSQEEQQIPAITSFIYHPYTADINPGKSEDRKLYLAATKERDNSKKIINNYSTTKYIFFEMVTSDSTSFGWGTLVSKITNAA